jgi:putative hydrolase of the HAD superfamily
MDAAHLKTLFFDLGDTLVRQVTITPLRFDWIPGAADLLRRLRLAQVPLGLISNSGNLTRAQLLAMLPSDFSFDLFETDLVLLSSEVNIEKPDLRIFRLAMSRAQNSDKPRLSLQIDPHHCLFVGESLKEVIAAQQVGMLGACVQRASESARIGNLDTILTEQGLLG